MKKIFTSFVTALSFVALLGITQPVNASCGCDKPPPTPSAVLPHFGWDGSKINIYNKRFTAGHDWNVKFTVNNHDYNVSVTAQSIKDITDPSGNTMTDVLTVTVPDTEGNFGPTHILAVRDGHTQGQGNVVEVANTDFTVIGSPIVLEEETSFTTHGNYRTGVDAAGHLYIPFDISTISKAMTFTGWLQNTPLHFNRLDVAFYNDQGYLLDPLDNNASHITHTPSVGNYSDKTSYFRHSFQQYYSDHAENGYREVGNDPDWHKNGTPHVGYSTVVVEVNGLLDGSVLPPGSMNVNVCMDSVIEE